MADASKKRVAGVIALWAAVMGSLTLVAGCFGHICDGDAVTFGRNAGEGHLIDANSWESNATDGKWLPYGHQRVYFMEFPLLGDRASYNVTPYVSASEDPIHEGGNWTVAAGNLSEISGSDKGKITLKNDTCADYFLRVVVEVPPRPTGTGASPVPASNLDAGSDADAGP